MDILDNKPGIGSAPILDKTLSGFSGTAQKFVIRKIRLSDNETVKTLIRSVLSEIGGEGEGTSYHDTELNNMLEAYSHSQSAFFVLTYEDKVIGTVGIGPLRGMDTEGICELRKFYLLSAFRGLGLGSRLLKTCLEEARLLGYRQCYLETHTKLRQAVSLYEQNGFQQLAAPMGNTGHTAPDLWYIRKL